MFLFSVSKSFVTSLQAIISIIVNISTIIVSMYKKMKTYEKLYGVKSLYEILNRLYLWHVSCMCLMGLISGEYKYQQNSWKFLNPGSRHPRMMVEMHYITGKKLPTPANMATLKKSRCFTTRYVHIAHFKTFSFIRGSLLHFYQQSLQMSTLPTRLQNHHHHLIIGWGAATFKFEVFYWKRFCPGDKITALSYPKAMFSQNTVISVDDFKSVSTDGFSDTSFVQKCDLIDYIIR